ncbi:MAG: hypothetical protein ACC631_05820 [Halocynthiibacter sp.]
MTALEKYDRLESTGLWRAAPEAQRRDVIVSFGDATLVLSDKNDSALTHWSLAAISRRNPGQRPALFSPDAEATETLELADETMIRAIEKVLASLARSQPKPGRMRLLIFLGSFAAVLALALFWLPGALVQQTASVVPDVTRARIGEQLLVSIRAQTGELCRTRLGERALNRLRMRLLPETRALVVVRSAPVKSLHLPGGYIVLDQTLFTDGASPDVAAGYILAQALRASQSDPLVRLLEAVGPLSVFRLLTTGALPDYVLEAYAEQILGAPGPAPDPAPDDEALLARFAEAGVRSTPYAFARDATGESTLRLIEADPYASTQPRIILGDEDWASLQEICAG